MNMKKLSIKDLRKAVLSGRIFIYPTDTIYGIGCNALDEKAVLRIREIKKRDEKPFSVIIPSFKWVEENCDVNFDLEKYLPGPYTIILKKKNPCFLLWVSPSDSLGVRIPDCEFTRKIQKIGVPFITTSVNFSGMKPANKINEIAREIIRQVDFVLDEGELSGKPSTLIVEGKKVER